MNSYGLRAEGYDGGGIDLNVKRSNNAQEGKEQRFKVRRSSQARSVFGTGIKF